MRDTLNELQTTQNPAFGAYLIWQFGLAFQADRQTQPSFALAFLVLPLLLHRQTVGVIGSTRKSSGLALFAAKLGEEQENLLAIHERALALRRLTLQSVGFAIRSGLVTVDYADASFRSNSPPKKKPEIPERIREFVKAAEKLGSWFSRVDVPQVAMTLKVDF